MSSDEPPTGPESPSEPPGAGRLAIALLYVGSMNAICVLGAMAVGWGVDHLAGTTPLFILLGLPFGILLGIVATIRVVRDYLGQ